MAGNGGIIGPNKVVNTPKTRTESFTSSGTFQKTNCTSTIPEIMVVAGGGAGGGDASGNCASSGGGGAGGYRTGTCVAMPNGSVTVTVGAGGAQGANPGTGNPVGASGSDSVICGVMTSTGGGGGAFFPGAGATG